jgi:hypothetical protein
MRTDRLAQRARGERGSSVLELMCVLLLMTIVLGTVFEAIVSVEKATSGTGARLQNLDEARVLMATVSRDVRTAVPLNAGASPFVIADANEIEFYGNLDTTAAPKLVHIYIDSKHQLIEQVQDPDSPTRNPNQLLPPYTYTTKTPVLRMVGRFVANNGANPIFTYLDATGTAMTPVPLSTTTSASVHDVGLNLTVYKTSPFNQNATTLKDQVRLPNIDYNAVAN